MEDTLQEQDDPKNENNPKKKDDPRNENYHKNEENPKIKMTIKMHMTYNI